MNTIEQLPISRLLPHPDNPKNSPEMARIEGFPWLGEG